MKNKKILITGGAGFIGSHLVESFLKMNCKKIVILDNLWTGYIKNIEPFLMYSHIEFIYGDITNLEICRKAVRDIDLICHQAALGSVPRSIHDPLSSHSANVNGFLNILMVAKEKGIKRVVYASSSSVYGDDTFLPKVENKTGNVLSPYAATKAIDEIYARVFTHCYNMECIGLRYFNVFGPRQDPHGAYAAVIPKFIDVMKNNSRPIIYGNGSFSRDFVYVENVVEANILALTTHDETCFGEVFNIGCGRQYNLNEVVYIINTLFNKKIEPIYESERKGDIAHSSADITKAKNHLMYNPTIQFYDGIKKCIDYMN